MNLNSEKGTALIAAIALIFSAAMLSAGAMVLAQIASFDVTAHTDLQRSFYINEGAANRIQWCIAADRSIYDEPRLGEYDYDNEEYERFVADGIEHVIDYYGYKVKFKILDAYCGYNLMSNFTSILNTLKSNIDNTEEYNDALTALNEKLTDYADSNDELSGDSGLEKDEYENAGKYPLPANSAIAYRGELAFIPGLMDIFPPDKYGRLADAAPVTVPQQTNQTVNFFAASVSVIRKVLNTLEEEDIEKVIAAREKWFKSRKLMSEEIDELLLADVKNKFSFSESGYHTVFITSGEDSARRASHTLIFTYQAFNAAGPEGTIVRYLEYWNL